MSPEFQCAVTALIAAIPPGKVLTYGRVAELAGYPRHARHVGRLLGTAPQGALPWHRVVGACGRIARPGTESADWQRALLEAEGVTLQARGTVDLARHLWHPEAGEQVGRTPASA